VYEIRTIGRRVFRGPLTSLSLASVLFLIQAFFLVNYRSFAPSGFSFEVGVLYIILCLGFVLYNYHQRMTRRVVTEVDVWSASLNALIGFMITWAAVLGIYVLAFGMEMGSVAQPAVMGLILTQCLFVAPSEELIFRGIMPEVLESKIPFKWIALIISQVLFAVFHFSAYGGSWEAMGVAFVMGMIWVSAYRWRPWFLGGKRLGIGFTIGSHAAYNLVLSGLLVGNVTMIGGL